MCKRIQVFRRVIAEHEAKALKDVHAFWFIIRVENTSRAGSKQLHPVLGVWVRDLAPLPVFPAHVHYTVRDKE